jgi:hypothetical protein
MQPTSRFKMVASSNRKKLFGLSLGLLMLDASSPGLANVPASASWQPAFSGGGAAHVPPIVHNGWAQPAFDVGKSQGSLHLVGGGQSAAHATGQQTKTGSFATHHLVAPALNTGTLVKQSGQFGGATSGGAKSIDLDLTSTTANIMVGTSLFGGAKQLTINVGGVEQSFKPGSMVTAGEYVALQQVAGHSAQGIVLSSTGAAVGGYFSLNAADKGAVSGIVVPASVSALDFTSKNSALTFTGDLTNYGSIYAISAGSKTATGAISAMEIINETGATISTSLPTSLVGAVGHSLNPNGTVNLTLNSSGDIVNAGTVTSSGALTLNIGSGNLTNNGLIASTGASINIGAPSANTDINISAKGGSLQALQGNINVRDASYSGTANINLVGGNYSAQNINLNSGTGAVTGSIGQTNGNLNTDAGAAHLFADTTVLTLGNNKISGDPTFVSSNDIVINGPVTAAESISIIAQDNITVGSGAQASVSTTGGTDADITLIAGATITNIAGLPIGTPIPTGGSALGPGQTAVLDAFTSGASGHGGFIDLATNNLKSSGSIIDASASNGNVTLAAFQNTSASGGTANGYILLPTGVTSINTAGDGTGNQGNVTIIAGGVNAANTAISMGAISTNNGGSINVSTSQPVSNSLVYASDGTHTGSLSAGAISSSVGKVVVGDLTAAGTNVSSFGQTGIAGGNITIIANGDVTTGNISSRGGNGGSGAAAAIGTGGNGGNGGAGGNVNISTTGSISTSSIDVTGGTGGAGGAGAADDGVHGAGAGGQAATGGAGGQVTLQSTASGTISIGQTTLDGGSGGMGGTGGAGGSIGAGGAGGQGGAGDPVGDLI